MISCHFLCPSWNNFSHKELNIRWSAVDEKCIKTNCLKCMAFMHLRYWRIPVEYIRFSYHHFGSTTEQTCQIWFKKKVISEVRSAEISSRSPPESLARVTKNTNEKNRQQQKHLQKKLGGKENKHSWGTGAGGTPTATEPEPSTHSCHCHRKLVGW